MLALTCWLRDMRKKQGLTMRDLGKRLGVTHSYIQKVETGERRLDVVEYIWYPPGHFKTVSQLIEETYIHEWQREQACKHWNKSKSRPGSTKVSVTPDIELEILDGDGNIHNVLYCCLILHEQQLAINLYKDISNLKQDVKLLKEHAYLDPLTGIANRRGLREHWHKETSGRNQTRLALLMVDLDNFKPVNDTYGHLIGDEVLRTLAHRFKSAIRDSDFICRFGGDEFCLLLTVPERFELLEDICQRIITTASEPIAILNRKIKISASIGGCIYPDHAADKRKLLEHADSALYQVKKSGKARWKWFSPNTI
ncbi:protein with unknown function [Dorcoceras hygrometricum]|uniref:GGDEF domain-containing protein n=1 Tax=Dorcoceras hygrometricum TaxID=472368 RepID=A0A2Z6ZYI6_9LAMI|nr:protein with unknown function [Dorcoceras hygrometricum]